MAIASSRAAEGRANVPAGVGIELLAASLFPALPVSRNTPTPLIAWLEDASDDESLDAFFTVQGTARDTERRGLEMERLIEVPAHVWENVDTIVTVESRVDFVFFVCVGGETDPVTDLLARAEVQAA
jgi:hypothetical protein